MSASAGSPGDIRRRVEGWRAAERRERELRAQEVDEFARAIEEPDRLAAFDQIVKSVLG